MKVKELKEKLSTFDDELPVVIAYNPALATASIMPLAPDTVKSWKVNDTEYVLIMKDPNQGF
jgi:hypothetical protein